MGKRKARKPSTTVQSDNAPTPERLAKATGGFRKGADGVTRLEDWPLSRLFARQHLSDDSKMNLALFEAGERLASLHAIAGLHGIKASDFNSSGGGAPGARGMPFSHSVAQARDEFQRVCDAIGPFHLPVVLAICIEGRKPEVIGRIVSGYADTKQARAVALDRLKGGLGSAARLFGYIGGHSGKARPRAWRKEMTPDEMAQAQQQFNEFMSARHSAKTNVT